MITTLLKNKKYELVFWIGIRKEFSEYLELHILPTISYYKDIGYRKEDHDSNLPPPNFLRYQDSKTLAFLFWKFGLIFSYQYNFRTTKEEEVRIEKIIQNVKESFKEDKKNNTI